MAALDRDGLVELVRTLIAVPSLDGREDEAQRTVAGWLDAAGLAADVWDVDLGALADHPHWSHEVERDHALGVVGWAGTPASPNAGRDLQLNGHIDVVPAGDATRWTSPPWSGALRDGRMYGRGAVDMKGGLACGLAAAKAVHDAGVPLLGRLSVASVVGEEDGGTGTLATILRGHVADGAVVMEPTRLRLVTAQAGSLMFRLVVRGLSAHGCAREEGVSALEKFLPLFAALRRLEAQRCGLEAAEGGSAGPLAFSTTGEAASPPVVDRAVHDLFAGHRLPWPIEVGTVSAGDWASSVPGVLVAEGRYGVAVGEDLASARQVFEHAVERTAAADPWLADHPPAVEWWGGRFEPALTDASDPVVEAVAGATESLTGTRPALEGVTYGADMRLLVNVAGIPTVLFGPGDVRVAHMPDEHVAVEELEMAAKCLIVAALRFCGHSA